MILYIYHVEYIYIHHNIYIIHTYIYMYIIYRIYIFIYHIEYRLYIYIHTHVYIYTYMVSSPTLSSIALQFIILRSTPRGWDPLPTRDRLQWEGTCGSKGPVPGGISRECWELAMNIMKYGSFSRMKCDQ